MTTREENTHDSPPHADPHGVNPGGEGPAQPKDKEAGHPRGGGPTPPGEPADPHPSDEEWKNVHNPAPHPRDNDLESDPRNPGSPA